MINYLNSGTKGINQLLELTAKLQNKNLNFFKNTFRYFLTEHAPFNNSLLYYDALANDFKFVAKSQVQEIYITKFKEYISGNSDIYIRESYFYYSTDHPYNIIVADADFILDMERESTLVNLEDRIEAIAEKFYYWYKVIVEKEIVAIKALLDKPVHDKVIKLF